MGQPNSRRMFDGIAATIDNECNYMRISRISEISVDPNSTKVPSGDPDPPSASSAIGRTETAGEGSDWINFQSHQPTEQGRDAQHNLQNLAIGSLPTQRITEISSAGGSNYMNTTDGSNNGGDSGLSPDTQHSNSNRPTPNSTTPSESRSNLQPGATGSGGTSYETSPASSHNARAPSADGRSMSSFFNGQPDYSNIPSTGLTPGGQFSMPETPGRDFDVPNGWDQTNGLTPVGEGVLRQLMGLGPLDPM